MHRRSDHQDVERAPAQKSVAPQERQKRLLHNDVPNVERDEARKVPRKPLIEIKIRALSRCTLFC